MKYGRTVHSLVKLLSIYKVTFNFVSVKELSIDENTKTYLENHNIKYNEYNSINEIIETTDVLYMTRVQKERLVEENIDYNYIENNLHLTQEIMTNAKKNMVIVHPLPRKTTKFLIILITIQEHLTLGKWKMDYILEWLSFNYYSNDIIFNI